MTDRTEALVAPQSSTRHDEVRPGAYGPGRWLTRCAQAFLVAIALWLVALGTFNLLHPSDWAMGDWLINYSGGFVRRGLIGELALLLHVVHVPVLVTALLLQCALYAVILATVWRLLPGVPWSWWTAALVFSPATLAFVLLDPPFAFRKDILFLALLALTLGHMRPGGRGGERALGLSLMLTLGCAVCVLSHEGLVVFLPYLFAAVYLVTRDLRRSLSILAVPMVVSAALFVVVSHHPGNAQVAQAVCASIGGTLTVPPSGICGGAIDYLQHDAAYAHHEVVRVMLSGRYWTRLPWLFLVPLLPMFPGLASLWKTNRAVAGVLTGAALLAWLASISVFYYGTDWTRWVYLHSFSLMLLMLFAAVIERPQGSLRRGMDAPERSSVLFRQGDARRWLAWGTLLLYCFGWELTVYRQRPLYASFVRFVTHNMARGRQ